LDPIVNEWRATDPGHPAAFKTWVKSVIDNDYELISEDGNTPMVWEGFKKLYDVALNKKQFPSIAALTRRLTGKLKWPEICHKFADAYKGEGVDDLNWKWIRDNYKEPIPCKSMFNDPRPGKVSS
jgi:hypothetical protein